MAVNGAKARWEQGEIEMSPACYLEGEKPMTHHISPATRERRPAQGFSLIEMMTVVAMILIVASISAPIYQTVTRRTRETVLRDHLYTLRSEINRFTLDKQRPPASLEELVEKGYLGRLPTDPFTSASGRGRARIGRRWDP
jgi:prepilin-type N-terminal cleavage/methylation domain-containing protein